MRRFVKHKYSAKRCKRGELKFPSLLERSCFDLLTSLKNSGKILFFLRQIPVDLDGSFKHVIDFMAFTDTEAFFIEAKAEGKKGRAPMGELKRKQTEERLGVQVHVVHKPEEILNVLFSHTEE